MGVMARRNWLLGLLGLIVLLGVVLWVTASLAPPTPGSRAYFRAISENPIAPAYSVPMELRRSNADTCIGFNLELEEGAGIQRRIGHIGEAERLLSMRQNCSASTPAVIRSAR